MIHPLYRKIYTYVIGSVFAAILLTFLVMGWFFQRDEKAMRERFLYEQVNFVQFILKEIALADPARPQLMNRQLQQMGNYMNWQISYWHNNQSVFIHGTTHRHMALTSAQHQKLAASKGPVVLSESPESPPLIAAYLNSTKPQQGYLQFSPLFNHRPGPPPGGPFFKGPPPGPPSPFPHRPPPPHGSHWLPPLLAALVIMLVLAILLIPMVRYILKPFKALSASIERVAHGDFSTPVEVTAKSEFHPIAAAFNHMVSKIQDMLQEKQRLIADVSHELRSPLARMRVSLELLAKEGKGKAKYIERSIFELEELSHLIDTILDVSALELNVDQYPLERLDLSQLVRENLEVHQLILQEHNLQIHSQFPKQPVIINGRRDLLERALNNLFSNVLKYAPDSQDLDITVYVQQDRAGIRIRDRGPGLPPEELEHILKPFYRPDISRTRKTGGTGLGLAIVAKIMQLHQGQIRVELPPQPEPGLVVYLEWPMRRSGQTARLEGGVEL